MQFAIKGRWVWPAPALLLAANRAILAWMAKR
jgi:hypothetical protein